MSASFSTWLSVGVGSRGTRRVDSTRALPCQEVSDADCRGNWKRPRLQAGEDLVNWCEQLPAIGTRLCQGDKGRRLALGRGFHLQGPTPFRQRDRREFRRLLNEF